MTVKDNAYITYPKGKDTKYGIVLFPDFMGYELVNAKLLVSNLICIKR